MSKTKLPLFLILWPIWLSGQTITGRVYIEGTDKAVPAASVYFNGSINGTSTNSEGGFSISAKLVNTPLIVSCIGMILKQ